MQHIVSYGIAHNKLGNIVAFKSTPVDEDTTYDGPWVSEVPRDEVVACYADWEQEVQDLLQVSFLSGSSRWLILNISLQPVEKALKWAIHALRPLPTYVHGKVALLGDAVSSE